MTIGSLTNNDPTPSWADKAAQATEEFINEIFDSPDGKITLGMPSVLVNNQPIATTLIPNSIVCNNHALQMIAEGSETVFIADKNVARKGDKTTCGAIIQNGSPNVFIGSGKAQVTKIADAFSFAEKALLVAVDMGFPPSRQGLKNGLGKIRLGIDEFSNKPKKTPPYSHIPDIPNVGKGKKFTKKQKEKLIEENMKKNNGIVKSDLSGKTLVKPVKNTKGFTPLPNEWQIDHINARSKGGSNSYSNAQILSRKENRDKSNK